MMCWERAPESFRLAPEAVHVWMASLDALPAEEMLVRLSADERARAERFCFEADRRRFVAGRGLLRGLLGLYLDVDPRGLRFAYGRRGKPSLATADRLRFNVAHSGGLALLAFARDRELGVDIERERPLPEANAIAERYFSAREGAELRRLPETERAGGFFRCWTRKEAFIKATGEGLSQPLDAFDVSFASGEPARLLRVEGRPEEGGRWWLQDLAPAPGFAGALAVEGRPADLAGWKWDQSVERCHGPRREGRQDDLQSRGEPRGAVLDLAG